MKIVCGILIFLSFLLFSCKSEPKFENKSDKEAYLEDFEESKYKWGYIDKTGRIVISNNFDDCGNFSEGLATANRGGMWGYIDKTGSFVIPPTYRSTWIIKEKRGRVLNLDGTYAFINTEDFSVIQIDTNEVSDFSHKRAVYKTRNGSGYIDDHGTLVIPTRYTKASSFDKNGFATVCIGQNCGVIDTMGNEVLDLAYTVKGISDEVAMVSNSEGIRYYDLNKQKWILEQYERGIQMHHNVVLVKKENIWYAIKRNGELLQDLGQQDHVRYLNERIWALRKDSQSRLWSSKHEFPQEIIADMFYDFKDGMTVYGIAKGFGYMDTTGARITPPGYPLLWNFHEGLARTIDQRGITYLDQNGREVFTSQYFEARDFYDGLARVQIR